MRMVRKRPHQASPSRMSQTQKMLFSGRHALIFHILSEYFMRHCKLTEISIFQINILGTHSRWMMLKPSPSSCTLLQSSFRKCTPPFGSHNMMPMFPHLVTSCFMQSLHFRSHLFLDFRSFPITNKNFLLQSCRMTDFACFDDISTSYNRLYRIVTHFFADFTSGLISDISMHIFDDLVVSKCLQKNFQDLFCSFFSCRI